MTNGEKFIETVARVDVLEAKAAVRGEEFVALANNITKLAQLTEKLVNVISTLQLRVTALETGLVYTTPGAGSMPSTSGQPMVRHHETISVGSNGVAQSGGQSPAC